MAVGLDEFLRDYEASGLERLDNGDSWRQVYAVDRDYDKIQDIDYPVVIKYSDRGIGKTQNRTELRAYLESMERDQGFLPEVIGGRADFKYLVSRRVNPLPAPSQGHPWRENPEMQAYAAECREVLPEGWIDNDDVELGVDDGDVKLLDGGTLRRNEWIVDEPLDHRSLEFTDRGEHSYFTVYSEV